MLDSFQTGFGELTIGVIVMFLIGGLLLYLGISRKMEPLLLVPIGFTIILVNLPLGGLVDYSASGEAEGFLATIFEGGLTTELIPIFIFLGLGAMTDFGPIIANPKTLLLGAGAQFGVFFTFFVALAIGFTMPEAASIGIIGGADGPTSIFLANKLSPGLLGSIAVAAYTYMAMVPIIQPPIIRLLTNKKERGIYMKPQLRHVSQREKILFPIAASIIIILLVPGTAPLIGMLMLGNLFRESGVTARLSETASGAFMNILIIVLGISVGSFMTASNFLNTDSLAVFGIGIVAFTISTAAGVMLAKFMNLFLKEKINPMIGAAGVSAVPMAARVVQVMGQKENPRNFLLMQAMGPNIAGVIGTATVAGIFLGALS
jgi:sodium ion-translocating decarboxylase beta subunit